jgi:hypothetical protein
MAILNRGTLLLLTGAIALGGSVLLLENQRGLDPSVEQSAATPAADASENDSENAASISGEMIFPFAEAEVEQLSLKRPEGNIAFTKKAAEGIWEMSQPQKALAEEGAIAFLLNQLASPANQTLTIEPNTLANFGLADPAVTIDIVAKGNPYQLVVGTTAFTGDQRYVRVVEGSATPTEPVKIHVVSGSLTNAINRPTPEWLAAVEGATVPPSPSSTPGTSQPENPSAEGSQPVSPQPENPQPESSQPQTTN